MVLGARLGDSTTGSVRLAHFGGRAGSDLVVPGTPHGRLRRQMRHLNALGEEVISASSAVEVLRRLIRTSGALQCGFGRSLCPESGDEKTGRRGFGRDRGARSTREAPTRQLPWWPPAFEAGADRHFGEPAHYAFKNDGGMHLRARFVGSHARPKRAYGGLALHYSERVHYFSETERQRMQHLANQVAAALKLHTSDPRTIVPQRKASVVVGLALLGRHRRGPCRGRCGRLCRAPGNRPRCPASQRVGVDGVAEYSMLETSLVSFGVAVRPIWVADGEVFEDLARRHRRRRCPGGTRRRQTRSKKSGENCL